MIIVLATIFIQISCVMLLFSVEKHRLRTMEYEIESRDRVAMGVLHDIANPLTFSTLYIEQKHSKGLVQVLDALKQINGLIEHARRQMTGVLETTIFSPADEIERAVLFLHHKLAHDHVGCTVHLDKGLTFIGDRYKFFQCVVNLISNAVDAYSGIRKQRKNIVISLSGNKKEIMLSVTDFGMGIAEEHQRKIFRPSFTTKPIELGTGIGLVHTKEIVEHFFNGSITFESRKNVGTVFTLHFPSALSSSSAYATLDAWQHLFQIKRISPRKNITVLSRPIVARLLHRYRSYLRKFWWSGMHQAAHIKNETRSFIPQSGLSSSS